MKKLCELARVFRARRHKRMLTCHISTKLKIPIDTAQSEVKCKGSYYVYCSVTETKLCHCASTRYVHWKVSRLCAWGGKGKLFLLFPASQYGPLYTACLLSVPTYWCQLWGVSFVTSPVPTTACPTQPTHYINLQVTVRTPHVARCM